MTIQPKIATVTLNPAIDQTISIGNFQAGKVNRVEKSRSDAGGKGVNVASILADFGFPVAVTGFLGKDNLHLFKQLFAKKAIEDYFVRISGSTRVGIKIVDEVNQATTDINFPGPPPSSADIHALMQVIEKLVTDCAWFVLSGSIPPGVSGDIYRHLIEKIQATGKRTALDTSGQPLARALEVCPALIKPNIDELAEISGRSLTTKSEILEAARRLVERGIETVVISMGEDGAFFVETESMVFAKPPSVMVKSTVGAGDAMLSGMVVGKIRELSLSECARLATACSLGAITRVGSGIPTLKQIEAFMKLVAIEKLDATSQGGLR